MAAQGQANNFDFLRFVAAISVIIAHSVPLTGNGHDIINFLTNGQMNLGSLAVDIFFAISGYLITASYLKQNNLTQYIIARLLRIFPALIVFVLIMIFMIGPIISNQSILSYFSSKLTYTYLKNITLYLHQYELTGFDALSSTAERYSTNGSLWTLRVEFSLYIVVAILGYCKLLNKFTVCVIFIMSFFITFIAKDSYLIIFFNLSTIFFGGSIFYLYRKNIKFNKYPLTPILILLGSCILGMGLVQCVQTVGIYIIFQFALSQDIHLHKFAKYGDFSYGIYIYGFPIQQILIHLNNGQMSNIANFMLAVPMAIFAGFISFHIIEKPCMRLKLKFANIKK